MRYRFGIKTGSFAILLALSLASCQTSSVPTTDPEPDPPTTIPPPVDPDDPTPPPTDGESCSDVCPTDTWAIVNDECRCGSDYLTVDRVGEKLQDENVSTGLYRQLGKQGQQGIAAIRNFMNVADSSCHYEEAYGMDADALKLLAREGSILYDGGRHVGESQGIKPSSLLFFIGEQWVPSDKGQFDVNRRCPDRDARPREGWCGRTGAYRPTFTQFNDQWAAWLAAAAAVDSRVPGCDGIFHYCHSKCGE